VVDVADIRRRRFGPLLRICQQTRGNEHECALLDSLQKDLRPELDELMRLLQDVGGDGLVGVTGAPMRSRRRRRAV
jgi:hypothetical protein